MRPRIGFVGLGRLGCRRLTSIVAHGDVEPAAYLEPDPVNLEHAQAIHPAAVAEDLDSLLDHRLDGVVIATPNAYHADQSRAALEHFLPVFCQKPLATRQQDAMAVITSAEDSDVRVDVDWSYRGTTALQALRMAVRDASIGDCYHADLAFHNAYGPGKDWYMDRQTSGGGCLLDLGCHLIDALQWVLPQHRFSIAGSDLYAQGRRAGPTSIEDHAVVALRSRDASANISCSWKLPGEGDADIRFTFHGDRGVARVRNVGGSFFDFTAELLRNGGTECLTSPPDDWGGRQAIQWVEALRASARGFDPQAWTVVDNARLLEETYACAS